MLFSNVQWCALPWNARVISHSCRNQLHTTIHRANWHHWIYQGDYRRAIHPIVCLESPSIHQRYEEILNHKHNIGRQHELSSHTAKQRNTIQMTLYIQLHNWKISRVIVTAMYKLQLELLRRSLRNRPWLKKSLNGISEVLKHTVICARDPFTVCYVVHNVITNSKLIEERFFSILIISSSMRHHL